MTPRRTSIYEPRVSDARTQNAVVYLAMCELSHHRVLSYRVLRPIDPPLILDMLKTFLT